MRNCFIDHRSRSIADLCDYYDRGMIITRINVPEASRGQGNGSALLKKICAAADAEGVTLFLEIAPSGPLNFKALQEWYGRYGFKPWLGMYRRQPKETK